MTWRGPRPPWYLLGPALLAVGGILVPLVYLVIRAFGASGPTISALIFRPRTLTLLGNTLGLGVGVLVCCTLVALPLAWLTTHTTLRGRRVFTLLSVLPLAMPSYVVAYAWLGLGGHYGMPAQLLGIALPRLSGYTGALLAISTYTFPYLFLNLRTAFRGLDPGLEEAARALGHRPLSVFFRITLPQLKPAYLAGTLLIGLHVLGDFGAVSLMRYETFSYAIYLQYSAAFDRVYAAWLALMLLALTGVALYLEYRTLRKAHQHLTSPGTARPRTRVALGRWHGPVLAALVGFGVLTLWLPLASIGYWMGATFNAAAWPNWLAALGGTLQVAAPTGVLAGVLALPLAYLSLRFPSAATQGVERVAYLGYATPPLAFALAFVFCTLHLVPALYQTFGVLVLALVLHFQAEALGPVRSALYQAPVQLEEAGRSLGYGRFGAFWHTTFPLIRGSLLYSMAFVFLSTMKELPITFLLSPAGFETLALNVWTYTGDALFGEAAPFALAIVLCSAVLVGLLLYQESRR